MAHPFSRVVVTKNKMDSTMSMSELNEVPSSFYRSIVKGELVPSKNQFP